MVHPRPTPCARAPAIRRSSSHTRRSTAQCTYVTMRSARAREAERARRSCDASSRLCSRSWAAGTRLCGASSSAIATRGRSRSAAPPRATRWPRGATAPPARVGSRHLVGLAHWRPSRAGALRRGRLLQIQMSPRPLLWVRSRQMSTRRRYERARSRGFIVVSGGGLAALCHVLPRPPPIAH